jgi:hypothetical protein
MTSTLCGTNTESRVGEILEGTFALNAGCPSYIGVET